MPTIRTDLAAEAHALWQKSAAETTELPGVAARDGALLGLPLTQVDILDEEGSRALGKPQGRYLTLTLREKELREPEGLKTAALALRELLCPMLPKEGTILVAGLGNPRLAVDALGPLTVEGLLVTRHLRDVLPELRPVAGLSGGVLGDTGLEAGEWIYGAAKAAGAAAVILVDALAAGSLQRLGTTVQLSDVGLVPGSGVGNHRMALDRDTLGVPVLSLGVPTVVDVSSLSQELPAGYFVTAQDMDRTILRLGKLLGLGLTLALQPELTLEEAEALLA